MATIILSAEHELRTTGVLSDATCRTFAQADDASKRGFEASFAFLGCSNGAAADQGEAVPAERRIAAIRLMMFQLAAHTDDPRWSSRMLEDMVDAALKPPGAAVSDVVRALFAVLAECPLELSDTQANFIREVGIHVVRKLRRAPPSEDFSWLAAVLADPNAGTNAAQAYLAAYTLPVSFVSRCRERILRALHSTRFEEDVKLELAD